MPSGRRCVAVLFSGAVLSGGAGAAGAAAAQAAVADDIALVATAIGDASGADAEGPISVPDPPAAVAALAKDRSLRIQWPDPAGDGGSRVLRYHVLAVPDVADAPFPPVVTSGGDSSGAVVPSLVDGVSYDVAVTAANDVGSSLPATATGTPRTVPSAPAVRSVTAGDGSAVVSWSRPGSDGGASIRAFVVTAAPSGIAVRVDGAAMEAKVSPLKNGAATTFTVTAVNAVGMGPASRASAAVTPRGVARFVVARQPLHRVVFGAPSTVTAALVGAGGVGVPAQRVELLAKVRPSTSWRRVASGRTSARGRITLRATLPASAALRLHHPVGVVAAPDLALRSAITAKRVTVSVSRRHTRMGMTAVVRGRVAPGQRVRSPVRLQRRVSGSWMGVASGRMTTRSRFVIRWTPERVGAYALRVVKPRDAARAAGTSGRWRHRVSPETTADVAADILRDPGITLATVHVSGRDRADARQNIVDVARGRPARRSCYGNAPCGSTRIDLRLLRAVRSMGTDGTITVSEIAGGAHAGGSAHYAGRAVDITYVNGRHVAPGTSYGTVVGRCQAQGASQVLTPSRDPYGGHSRHVHCAWP